LEVHNDSWYVVYAFVGCCDCCAHPTSLTQISFSRENSHEMSAAKEKRKLTALRSPHPRASGSPGACDRFCWEETRGLKFYGNFTTLLRCLYDTETTPRLYSSS